MDNNVSLIFDAKKNCTINYSFAHFVDYPEMKKYLIHVKNEHGYHLLDTRTNKVIMSSSNSLLRFLDENKK